MSEPPKPHATRVRTDDGTVLWERSAEHDPEYPLLTKRAFDELISHDARREAINRLLDPPGVDPVGVGNDIRYFMDGLRTRPVL